MKVLHLISSSGMYGAEAVILALSKSLCILGHGAALGVFLNSAQSGSQLFDRAESLGMEVYRVECEGQIDLSVPGAIRKVIASSNADILHAHGYKADLYSYAAVRSDHIPLVSTCHTWYDNDIKVRFYGMLDRWILKAFAAVVAVSVGVEQRLQEAGVPKECIRLIRNGIDANAFTPASHASPSQRETLSIGLVGRLSWEKGIDVFLRAAALVHARLPNVSFTVAGEGPDHESLHGLIEALGLGSNARLLGRVDQLTPFYHSLDLLVSASRQEGLPIALLEGMASALPIVATTVGEVPRVVQHQQTGLLVAPEDPNALAQSMITLLQDVQKRESFGAAGRALVEQEFSSDRMAREYLNLYEQVIGGSKHAHSKGRS